MNILFTTSAAPSISAFSTDEKRPPLGLGSLISLVRREGHQVFFIDNYLKPSTFIEDGFLQEHSIDLVGIYANTICYRDTLRMFHALEALRQQEKWHGKIAVGGPHTSVALHTIPDFVDYIVQGEGEKALLAIIDGSATERIIRGEREYDLDSLPFQPWDIFGSLSYDDTCRWMDSQPVFTMNTSRGCPFQCTFCSVNSVWGAKYTYMSAERVLAEVEHLVTHFGAKGIYFREDHFTLNAKRTREFCEQLSAKNYTIEWACETRVDNLSEDLIRLMSSSGCKALYLGIESGCQRVLDRLQKGITVEQIEQTIIWCKRYNIRTYCSLIVGTPGESFEEYLQTKRLMERLKPYTYTFNVFVGIPNSQLYRHVVENKLYEHMDDLGIAYLPGYDVKVQFFYGRESRCFVEHTFTQRTEFDKSLRKEQYKKNVKNLIIRGKNAISSQIPREIKDRLKKVIRYVTS